MAGNLHLARLEEPPYIQTYKVAVAASLNSIEKSTNDIGGGLRSPRALLIRIDIDKNML